MATQYSNKPIVTNGLVYALDFGNQKSYVSGSTSARSLKFGSVTGSILTFGGASIPNLQNGLLKMVAPTSTTGSTVDTLQQFSDLIPSGDFTIQLVVNNISNSGIFMTQGPSTTRFVSNLNTNSTLFGWYFPTVQYGQTAAGEETSRTYPITLRLQHITYRYVSGSFNLFINGVPVPTSNRNLGTTTQTGNFTVNGRGTDGSNLATLDLGNLYIYNRALTSDEIYSNYLIQAQRYGLPTIAKPYTIDENAFLFLSQSGITDPIITSSINTFVLGLKSASLWDKMIAIYPFVGTGSVGVNLTGSQSWNLKEPTSAFYKLSYTGSWNGSTSGSTPSGSNTSINTGVLPFEYYPFKSDSNQHLSILSYDTPTSSSMLAGTGMTREVAVSTLAGDYGTPAAAYSVRKVRTAYSGALMDVRRSIDNVTSSIGYVSNGDLDTGSLLNFANAVGENSPGSYSGLAAAYSLRRVSASYAGPAIDVRRDSDNTTGSIGFDASGNLDTGALLAFVTGSANTGSGFVAQWYDQSGNNKHATQTTASIQPLIISSGSIILNNGKPCLDARNRIGQPTGSVFFNIPSTPVQTLFGTLQPTTVEFINYYAWGANQGFFIHGNALAANTGLGGFDGTNARFDGSGSLAQQLVYKNIRSSKLYVSKNGGTETDLGTFNPITVTQILAREDNTYQFALNGYAQELLLYNSDQSANKPLIENNINNYYSIYTSSNAGYVARWYDQSGNNRHATQTTSSRQPLIVESGSVTVNSTRPGFKWNVSQSLTNIGNFTFNNVAWVAQATDTSGFGTIINTYRGDGAGGEPLGTVYNLRANGSAYLTVGYGANADDLVDASGLTYYNGSIYAGNSILNRHLGFVKVASGTRSSANGVEIGIHYASSRAWKGYINEVILYSNDQITFREPIEYNINNYYNIYPQTSSFTTSSFAIYATSGSVSASLNNDLVSGISSTGPLGFITVSRTGSNSLTIARNGVTSSFAVPASGALSTGIYLGAINNNGLALANSPLGISFASVGTGLTGAELGTFNELVGGLNINLRRAGVLNTHGALAAYSLRKLDYGYTGPAVTVRRTSDNTTSSIGFDSFGNLDTGSLLTFTGTSSAFVTTWHDQSGNNKHISQAVTGSQPLLVRSGSVITPKTFETLTSLAINPNNNNTKPAIYFNGAFLDLGTSIGSITQASYYLVFNLARSSDDAYTVMQTNTTANNDNWKWYGNNNNSYINMFSPDGSGRRFFNSNGPTFPVAGTTLWSAYHGPGSNMSIFLQGNINKGTDTSLSFSSGSMFRVGRGSISTLPGSIQELILYPDAFTSRKNFMENNINNFYQIY